MSSKRPPRRDFNHCDCRPLKSLVGGVSIWYNYCVDPLFHAKIVDRDAGKIKVAPFDYLETMFEEESPGGLTRLNIEQANAAFDGFSFQPPVK